MRVDDQRPITRAAANEVVAGVAHNQPEVVAAGKVDTGLDMLGLGCHNNVDAIVAQRAAVGRVLGGPARVVGEVGPERCSRLAHAGQGGMSVWPHISELKDDSSTYVHDSLSKFWVASAHLAASYVFTVPRSPSKVL